MRAVQISFVLLLVALLAAGAQQKTKGVQVAATAEKPGDKPAAVKPDDEVHIDQWEDNDGPEYDIPDDFVWESLSFEDCGSTTDLQVVQISSCTYEFDQPCRIPIDRPVQVTAEFDKRDEETSHMRHEAFWVISNINNPVAVAPERCSGADCPFQGPDGLAFTATVAVPKRFPEFRGTLFWKTYDADGDTLICFKTPIELYHPTDEEQEGDQVHNRG